MENGGTSGTTKRVLIAAGVVLVLGLVAGGVYFLRGGNKGPAQVAEPDPEDKIIITIQTEIPEEVAVAEPVAEETSTDREPAEEAPRRSGEEKVSSPPPSSAPVKTSPKPKPESTKETAAAVRTEPPAEAAKSPAARTEVPSNQEASLRPMTAPKSPDDSFREKSDLEKIKTVVRRQEVAFEGKDVDLYMADLISQTPKLRKDIEGFFDRFSMIEIDFEVEDVKIQGPSAEVILHQETRLVPKSGSRTQTASAKILWGLLKVGGEWKINETKILDNR